MKTRLLAVVGHVLVAVGAMVLDVVDPLPPIEDVDSCARCRQRYVMTDLQLASLAGHVRDGVPLEVVAMEAHAMYWVGAD